MVVRRSRPVTLSHRARANQLPATFWAPLLQREWRARARRMRPVSWCMHQNCNTTRFALVCCADNSLSVTLHPQQQWSLGRLLARPALQSNSAYLRVVSRCGSAAHAVAGAVQPRGRAAKQHYANVLAGCRPLRWRGQCGGAWAGARSALMRVNSASITQSYRTDSDCGDQARGCTHVGAGESA